MFSQTNLVDPFFNFFPQTRLDNRDREHQRKHVNCSKKNQWLALKAAKLEQKQKKTLLKNVFFFNRFLIFRERKKHNQNTIEP